MEDSYVDPGRAQGQAGRRGFSEWSGGAEPCLVPDHQASLHVPLLLHPPNHLPLSPEVGAVIKPLPTRGIPSENY